MHQGGIGDTVLDPFGGAGTTGVAAAKLGRDAVLIELNPDYVEMAQQRLMLTEARTAAVSFDRSVPPAAA